MPTIDQLAAATAASDTDELIASQSGTTRKVTRAQVVAGLQPQISVPSGSLLGRASSGIGAPETLTIGANLSLTAGTLSAVAALNVGALPAGTVPATGDLVPLSQGGANTAVPFAQFMSGLPEVSGVDGSQLLVTPTGGSTSQKLADLAAASLPTAGGTMTGAMTLAGDPTGALQPATKQYVDAQAAAALLKAGGTMTGTLTLAADPLASLQATTKQYVDAKAAAALPTAGGTMTGALLLATDPVANLQAATKQYVDSQTAASVPAAGGTMTGALTLALDPTSALQAATKHYVDAQVATALPIGGGAMTGPLSLSADPASALQAATKQYVDAGTASGLPRAGGTMTGALVLASDPGASLQAATKQYVDAKAAAALPVAGGTLSGALTLAADPTAPLQAATKHYVDNSAASGLPITGGALTGALTLAADPTSSLQAATKHYVDTAAASSLPLAGGLLTGALTLASDPTSSLQAATKRYVDNAAASSLPVAGGTLTGPLLLAADPTVSQQAATKHYVDGAAAASLPTAGGTLTGALTLAADPTSVLQAATKRYVDTAVSTALPIAGGTLTGSLTAPAITTTGNATIGGTVSPKFLNIAQTGSQSTQSLTQANLQRTGSGPTDQPLVSSTMLVNHSGGGATSSTNVLLTSTVNDAVDANGNFVDGMDTNVYAFISALNVNAVRGSTASATGSQHVAVTGAATRSKPVGGYPAGRVGAEVWGLWLPVTDATAISSDIGGAMSGIEMDMSANHLDPVNRRLGYQMVLGETTPVSSGGIPCEWAYGLYYTTGSNSYYKYQISAGGNYSVAVLDTRNAFGGKSKVTTALTAASPTIAVDPVLPFTSAGVYGNPVSATNTAQIKVGANTYTQVGFTLDGAGKTSGTLTFSTAVSVADGAANSVVVGASRTIWMATGQQIAFDYGGTINLFYDSTINATHLTAPLQVDGQLNAGGGITGTSIAMSNGILGLGSVTAGNASTGNTLAVNGAASGSAVSLTASGKDTNVGIAITAAGTGTITMSGGAVTIANGGLNVNNGTVFSTGGYTGTNVAVTGYVLAYGYGQFGGMLTANGGLTVSGLVNLSKYKVASLPAAAEGALAYAMDGRKPGEASGAGTGVLVVGSHTSKWISVTGGTVVAS